MRGVVHGAYLFLYTAHEDGQVVIDRVSMARATSISYSASEDIHGGTLRTYVELTDEEEDLDFVSPIASPDARRRHPGMTIRTG